MSLLSVCNYNSQSPSPQERRGTLRLSSSWTNSSRLSSAVAAREMRAIVASVCSSYVTRPKYPKYAVSAAAIAKPPRNMAAEPGTLLDRDHGSLLAGLWP